MKKTVIAAMFAIALPSAAFSACVSPDFTYIELEEVGCDVKRATRGNAGLIHVDATCKGGGEVWDTELFILPSAENEVYWVIDGYPNMPLYAPLCDF